jgi:transposase
MEFHEFMDQVIEEIPGVKDPDGGIELHVILNNFSIHKGCDELLAAHPNVSFFFTPTYASWRNLCEVFFGKLTRHSLKGANFLSFNELPETIEAYVKVHKETLKLYRWRNREVKGALLRNTYKNFCD